MKTTLIGVIMLCQIAFIQAQAPCPPSSSNTIHIVQKGETLYGISRQHKLSLTQLTQWNSIDENAILLPCTTLTLVQVSAKSVPSRKEEIVPQMYNNSAGMSAKTRPTLSETRTYIAGGMQGNSDGASFQNPSVANINPSAKLNNIASPNYSYFSQSSFVPFYHITSDGETRQSIGIMYGLSESDVTMMNNLSSNTGLVGGQKLVLEHRDQKKTQPYVLERIDNTSKTPALANSMTPQSYNQKPQYSEPNIASANEFGNRPSKTVEQLNEKPIKQPQPQSTKPEPVKPANKAPLSNNTSMSNEEMEMVNEINLMRQNPAGYVQYIKEYIANLQKNGDMGAVQTAYELIGELDKSPKLSTLQPLQCVYTAAKKHGEDQKSRGSTDHTGSDGSMPWDRVLRECPNLKDGNENLVGGPSDIRRAVILLLVDDGIETRGHRRTLLNPEWQYVACYKMGLVGTMPNCWVQNFGF
jgi:LysM repeat protein